MIPLITRKGLNFLLFLCSLGTITAISSTSDSRWIVGNFPRGGGPGVWEDTSDAFEMLAEFVQEQFPETDPSKLIKALERLSNSQQTFKGLDGAAHEAYQRTHSGDDIDTSVSGRAQRSAARLGATTEGLLACELVEMVEQPHLVTKDGLAGREVLLNLTLSESSITMGKSSLAVLLLYEPSYDGGTGLDHGSLLSLSESPDDRRKRQPKGRLLVVLADSLSEDLVEVMSILNKKPQRIKLSSGLVTDEIASVQTTLYKTAGKVLTELEPYFRKYNSTAVHFVGRSLAGGVASLASTMLDGTLPLPKSSKRGKKNSGSKVTKAEGDKLIVEGNSEAKASSDDNEEEAKIEPLSGLGRGRCSAMTLGAPPCLSSNVVAAFCTSFLYGDDVVSRSTSDSIERLCERIQRNLEGGFVSRNMGWMSDTLSLTVSSLKSHAHGSEGEEAKLAVPGRAFLVRPRRLGSSCSIHEVGNQKKGGREALRANLLWQLQDVLLSKSMWKHHMLKSYIDGLDRLQLRGSTDELGEEAMY